MTATQLWAVLATLNPEGPDAFLATVGPDPPHSLESFLLLYPMLPVTAREAALVALVLTCVAFTADCYLPPASHLQ